MRCFTLVVFVLVWWGGPLKICLTFCQLPKLNQSNWLINILSAKYLQEVHKLLVMFLQWTKQFNRFFIITNILQVYFHMVKLIQFSRLVIHDEWMLHHQKNITNSCAIFLTCKTYFSTVLKWNGYYFDLSLTMSLKIFTTEPDLLNASSNWNLNSLCILKIPSIIENKLSIFSSDMIFSSFIGSW